MKVLADEKKKEGNSLYTNNTVSKYLHFLATWNKFDPFHFQIFCLKRGNLSSQIN